MDEEDMLKRVFLPPEDPAHHHHHRRHDPIHHHQHHHNNPLLDSSGPLPVSYPETMAGSGKASFSLSAARPGGSMVLPRSATGTAFTAGVHRPLGPVGSRALASSIVQSISDAVLVQSTVGTHLVPWSVAQFETLTCGMTAIRSFSSSCVSLVAVHNKLHFDWWQALVSTTLLFRFLVLPLNVSLVRNTARLYTIRSQVMRLDGIMKSNTSSAEQKARDVPLYRVTDPHDDE